MINHTYLDLYQGLMEEIKIRMKIISVFLTTPVQIYDLVIDTEFICLQFRNILELIAMASLVSNVDEYKKYIQISKLSGTRKKTLKKIEKINPDFFPIALKKYDNPWEPTFISMEPPAHDIFDTTKDVLNKSDFIKIYDNCSQWIHTSNPFSKGKEILTVEKLSSWLTKIFNLLEYHRITILNRGFYFVTMSAESYQGKALVIQSIELTEKMMKLFGR